MKFNTREIVLAGLFAALAAVAAVMLRFGGSAVVPFSLLPLIALLSGTLLGPRVGAAAMSVYLIMGLVGFPVFAKPPYGGPAYVLQPTFGFIIGFVLCALVVGLILQMGTGVNAQPPAARYVLAMIAGLAAIYGPGLVYLWAILNFVVGQAMSLAAVVKIAFLPFIVFDLVKAVIVIGLGYALRARLYAATVATGAPASGK